jgi:ABC-type microcin C transport system permease subunit YejB
MLQFIIRRVSQLIPVILGINLLTFILMYIVPGDPVLSMMGERYDEETLERLREQFHLNDPLWKQFGHYLWGLLHGDLGVSFITQRPVTEMIELGTSDTEDLRNGSLNLSEMFRKNENNQHDRGQTGDREDPQAPGPLGKEGQTSSSAYWTAISR